MRAGSTWRSLRWNNGAMTRTLATEPLQHTSQPHDPATAWVTRTQQLVHIRELDGLRGVAALMVLFHHLWFVSYQHGGTRLIALLSSVSEFGRTGVDLFFVLSGFLITSLLIKARHSKRFYQDFYWKRVLRVLPLYALCLVGVALFQRGSLPNVVLAAFFLANFASVLHIVATGPFWTLAIEEQFYILWPTMVRRHTVDALQHWAVFLGVGCVLLRLVAAWFGHYNYFLSFLRCDGLAFGALLACWFMQGGERLGGTRRERLTLMIAPLLGLAMVLASALLQTPTLRAVAFAAALQQTGVALLAGSIVGFLIQNRQAPYLAVFRGRVLTFFGLISYALYMLHIFVLQVWDHVAGTPSNTSNLLFAERSFGIMALSIAFALLSRYAVELPALSLRRYVLPPRT